MKEIKPLTSVRGIAAIAVVLMHYSATMQALSTKPIPSLAPHGYLAVDFFFVLSGFIMAYTYLRSFSEARWRYAYRNFLVKRVARIVPLNIALVAILIIMLAIMNLRTGSNPYHISSSALPGQFLANATMLSGFGIGTSINWPSWSISLEFLAYMLFPVLIAVIFNRNAAVMLFGIIAALLVVIWVCAGNAGLSPGGIHNHFFPIRDVGRCLGEFTLGLAAYRAFDAGWMSGILRRDAAAIALVTVAVVVVVLKLGDLFAIVLFPPLIISIGLNRDRIANFLSSAIPYFFGECSFSLYMVHDNFRRPAEHLMSTLFGGHTTPFLALALAAIWGIAMILPAWLCYRFIEKPSRRALRRILQSSGPMSQSESLPTQKQSA